MFFNSRAMFSMRRRARELGACECNEMLPVCLIRAREPAQGPTPQMCWHCCPAGVSGGSGLGWVEGCKPPKLPTPLEANHKGCKGTNASTADAVAAVAAHARGACRVSASPGRLRSPAAARGQFRPSPAVPQPAHLRQLGGHAIVRGVAAVGPHPPKVMAQHGVALVLHRDGYLPQVVCQGRLANALLVQALALLRVKLQADVLQGRVQLQPLCVTPCKVSPRGTRTGGEKGSPTRCLCSCSILPVTACPPEKVLWG